ncbi:TetR/AcrR family transcriptional regulator [Niallia circulans]|uniref:TetR/AcrR family transcriptional regulator n=1 Tax=Niallia circulans TaxID=1397 RepID=UPI00077C52A9|nr:TetR/AcrR family transcriptional regulator [Niallia circulans]MDR4316193.1 TetR/AcrR family transcriptional regulator [Niallia circulans]MED3839192.1 TetR/AcrR family transcriptional regulator [Niallia circulans]MED4245575.1 TetR/AcrR family transcriptional regulator [Niallia circulans]MED4250585.1 TetR/AcrR family transcriptional regulator [Niallia circulans]QKH60634.1 TetR/AcrR family transcriptional regulator [Niallia circulans]
MTKKQLIMEKSIELFAKQGFAATSVQQITEHCGISKGAFYLSFKSKDELIMALVDYFMEQFIAKLDYAVNHVDDILYHFYYEILYTFKENSSFATLFIKEQALSFNDEFIRKFTYYDHLLEKTIEHMIGKVYDSSKQAIKYDLVYSIKGFLNTYTHIVLNHNKYIDFDLHRLAKSLVEKTDIIASYTESPYFTESIYQLLHQSVIEESATKEDLLQHIKGKMEEVDDHYVKESLSLLIEQLEEKTLNSVLLKGLLENIRHHRDCIWLSYLLFQYFQLHPSHKQ